MAITARIGGPMVPANTGAPRRAVVTASSLQLGTAIFEGYDMSSGGLWNLWL